MSTLNEISMESLSFNPFTKIGKEWMLITAGNEDKANTMTASWGGLGIMWGKNVVFVVIRETRYTKEFIDANEDFSLTFLSEDYRSALNYLGTVSGRDEDKIAKAGLHLSYKDGVPYLAEGKMVLTCKKMSATPITPDQFLDGTIEEKWYKDGNLHTLYIGVITSVLAE